MYNKSVHKEYTFRRRDFYGQSNRIFGKWYRQGFKRYERMRRKIRRNRKRIKGGVKNVEIINRSRTKNDFG